MKKVKVVLFVILFSFFAFDTKSFSQTDSQVHVYGQPGQSDDHPQKPKLPQCIKQGDFIIDGYWGFPYFWGLLLQNVVADSAKAYGLSVHNTQHIGGRFEYMVNDKIGIGMEYTYADCGIDYTGTNSKGNPQIYTIGLSKQRILGKINIHFATGPKIDPYATFGVGYAALNVYANEPGANVSDINSSISSAIPPIAIRAGIGLRYFFTDNFGLNAEFGLGGPLLQAGVTVKI